MFSTPILSIMTLALFVTNGVGLKSNFNTRVRVGSTLKMCNKIATDSEHATYLRDVALIEPPLRLDTLLALLKMRGEEIIPPRQRESLNPFLIPLSKAEDGSMHCYIRWPTQKPDVDIQIVKTTESGVKLVALSTDHLCKRIAVEMDFYTKPESEEAIKMVNKDGDMYQSGDYLPLLKSGKFPTLTPEDLHLVLARFLLTKVAAFPDCYEDLARDYVAKGDITSALVTCERAVSVFYGWGHPMAYHAQTLHKVGRDKEARDTARAALSNPLWTVTDSFKDLDELAVIAGFTGSAILGEMHAYRAKDPRTEEISEGLSPIQLTLDQTAHYMDAVAIGTEPGGWVAARETVAAKYTEGGYPELSKLIRDYEK